MIDMYKWTIYKIINPKGRIYIGKTNNFKKRLGDYRNVNCSNQKLVYKSLKKYGFQNHKIEIKTSKNGDSAASKIVINIDSDNEDINDALDKAQEKIDEAREKIEDAETIDISNIDEEDNRLYRQHYIFKMVNGELVPID